MKLFSSTEIGMYIGRGRQTVNMIAERLDIEPLRTFGNRRIFNETQAAAIVRAFVERSVFKAPGRSFSNTD